MLTPSCRRLAMVVLLGAAACGRNERQLLPPAQATAAASDLLYRDNLIIDPEVNARMNEYILQVSRDGKPAEAVMPVFHRWLAEWAREHPDRVAAARAGGGLYHGVRQCAEAPGRTDRGRAGGVGVLSLGVG